MRGPCPQPFSYLNVIPSDSGAERNEGSHPSHHPSDSYPSST